MTTYCKGVRDIGKIIPHAYRKTGASRGYQHTVGWRNVGWGAPVLGRSKLGSLCGARTVESALAFVRCCARGRAHSGGTGKMRPVAAARIFSALTPPTIPRKPSNSWAGLTE